MNKKFGIPVAALIAVGVVIAALAGALIATAWSDKDDDDDAVVLTTTAAPTGAVAVTDDIDPNGDGDADPVIDRDEQPLTAAEADRVARAALRIAGGGTVTDLGRSDDPGEAYEVEVQTEAGEIDIALDENLNRVSNNPYDD